MSELDELFQEVLDAYREAKLYEAQVVCLNSNQPFDRYLGKLDRQIDVWKGKYSMLSGALIEGKFDVKDSVNP